nr:PREDICTED: uncharacterized protein LOC109032074 isoform X1 [Bemisia tabaci]
MSRAVNRCLGRGRSECESPPFDRSKHASAVSRVRAQRLKMEFRAVPLGALSLVTVALSAPGVEGAPPPDDACYTGATIFAAVLGTLVITFGLIAAAYVLQRIYWNSKKGKHLILVTDPEKGGDFAFDNPGFREGTPINHVNHEKEEGKIKWPHFTTPINVIGGNGATKPRALDDSFVGEPLINVVPLRSHDFTGLGFNICGNMRDGIFVKDVLHRGPASESGKIVSGDRITSVRISFKHMVFEDALTILSYASPYEVQLEVENGSSSGPSTLLRNKKPISPAERICHPFYRSQSISDLSQIGKTGTRLIKCEQPASLTDMTTVGVSRQSVFEITPNKSSEKAHKFGVRVLPDLRLNQDVKSPNYIESEKQNACNTMLENSTANIIANTNAINHAASKAESFDEVDLGSKQSNGGNSHTIEMSTGRNTPTSHFKEHNVKAILVKGLQNLKDRINLPHIHKNSNGKVVNPPSDMEKDAKAADKVIENPHAEGRIKLETVPMKNEELQQVVVSTADVEVKANGPSKLMEEVEKAVSSMQKSAEPTVVTVGRKDSGCSADSTDDTSGQKKSKRKAPMPPQESKSDDAKEGEDVEPAVKSAADGLEAEVMNLVYFGNNKFIADEHPSLVESIDSDSEVQSSTTIELNSSHITVHHVPEDTNRKAASLGDLSKIADDEPSAVLERAMSLDMADGTPRGSKKRKAPLPPQEDFVLDDAPFCKEPRLDLVGLSKLKKSSCFGTMEEALSQSQDFDRSLSDSDEGVSEKEDFEPSMMSNKPDLICSTPMKPDLHERPKTPPAPKHNVSSVNVDGCNWEMSSSEAFVTAMNDTDDTPPELPTSPVPTLPSYVTEIQVMNANESNDITTDELTMVHQDTDSHNHNHNHNHTSEGSQSNDSSDEARHPNNDIPSPVESNSSIDTAIYAPQRNHKTNNDISPFLNKDSQKDIGSYQFNFKSENMSDEEILALKTSALTNNITPPKPKMTNGETPSNGAIKQSKLTPPSKIQKPNVSVTPIKASGSRIPIRATPPEPSARYGADKNRKRSPEPNKFVSFSTFNVSPSPRSLTNDHKFQDRNSTNNENITQIILDQK